MSLSYLADVETLGALFLKTTARHRDRDACTYRPGFRTRVWSYRDLRYQASAIAELLEIHGVSKGDRVILQAQNSPHWVTAFFGIQVIGAVPVPLPPESSREFTERIITETQAPLVLSDPTVRDTPLNARTLRIDTITVPSTERPYTCASVQENEIAEIVYTSGTTSAPKGVMLTHANILSNVRALAEVFHPDETYRLVSILPLFHMFEQTGGMLAPLAAGARISYAISRSPSHLRRIFEDDRPTTMLAVPEFLERIHGRVTERSRSSLRRAFFSTLRIIATPLPMALRRRVFGFLHSSIGWHLHTIVSGGAPLDPAVARFFEDTGIYILQGYGLTETSPILTANTYTQRKHGSVGKPLSNVSMKLSADGEVLAKGPNIFPGYWPTLEEQADGKTVSGRTTDVFTDDGWFQTGDLGILDDAGFLSLQGRKEFVIILPSGENVFPDDIERELSRTEEVEDAAVIGINTESGEYVHAVLLMAHGGREEAAAVVERVNARLMPYQRIRDFSIWPEADFPRTPTRKIRKPDVKAWVEEQSNGDQSTESAPETGSDIRSILTHVVARDIQQPIEDDTRLIEDLGIDSLGRIDLIARIEAAYDITIDEASLAPGTTVGKLKSMVESREGTQRTYRFPASRFTTCAEGCRRIFQPIILGVWRLFAPVTVRGLQDLPAATQPVIYYCNHISGADGPTFYAALPADRRVRLAGAAAVDVMYEEPEWPIRLMRPILEYLFVLLPFDRHRRVKMSFEYIGRALDRGYSVLIFPEGHIADDGEIQQLADGAARLATEMNVPIVPVKLKNTDAVIPPPGEDGRVIRLPSRHPVSVTFGIPMIFAADDDQETVTRTIREQLQHI